MLDDADVVNVDSLKGRNGDEDEARRAEASLTEEARKSKRDSDDDGHVLDQGGDAATTWRHRADGVNGDEPEEEIKKMVTSRRKDGDCDVFLDKGAGNGVKKKGNLFFSYFILEFFLHV